MVLAAIYSRRKREEALEEGREEGFTEGREEGFTEGRTEGLAEANAAWRAWHQRKQAAEDAGLPFDEPLPDADKAGKGADA